MRRDFQTFRRNLKDLLARQSVKNTFWNLFSMVLYPLFLLGTTPVFIARLGAEQFGIWMLVNSISQAMSVVNLGLGDANIKYISNYRAHADYDGIRKVVSTTFGLSVAIAGVIIFLGVIFSYLTEYYGWFKISEDQRGMMITCIRLALVLFSLKFLEIVVLSVFQGFERYDVQSRLALFSKTAIMVVNLIWVSMGGDLIVVLSSGIITQVAFLILEVWLIKRQYPYIVLKLTFQKDDIKRIFSFSLWTWVQSVLAIVAVNVDKFVVALFSGVQMLSYYALGYMVMTQVHAVFSASIGWIFPAVSRKAAKNESLSTFYYDIQAVLVVAGFTAIVSFLILDQYLIPLWLGDKDAALAYPFIHLFVYTNIFYLLNIVPHHFLNGSGFVKYNTYTEIMMKVVNVVGMLAGYYWFGNTGLIWGIIVTLILTLPVRIGLARHFALKEKGAVWYALKAVFCGVLIVVCFVVPLWGVKLAAGLICLWLVFYTFVRPSRFLMSRLGGRFKEQIANS